VLSTPLPAVRSSGYRSRPPFVAVTCPFHAECWTVSWRLCRSASCSTSNRSHSSGAGALPHQVSGSQCGSARVAGAVLRGRDGGRPLARLPGPRTINGLGRRDTARPMATRSFTCSVPSVSTSRMAIPLLSSAAFIPSDRQPHLPTCSHRLVRWPHRDLSAQLSELLRMLQDQATSINVKMECHQCSGNAWLPPRVQNRDSSPRPDQPRRLLLRAPSV